MPRPKPRPRPRSSPEPIPESIPGPTVGDIIGLPADPYLPGFASMADTPEELKDPSHDPTASDQPRASDQPQGLDASDQPRGLDASDQHRPGDNEPPPGQRPPEEPPESDDPDDDGDDEDPDAPEVPEDIPPGGADAPGEPDAGVSNSGALSRRREQVYAAQRKRYSLPAPRTPGIIQAAPGVRYESRIAIVDAWRYPGALATAPAWVDRNWVGYADHDPVRGIEPGPCLRVPSHADPAQVVLARVGDYVCRESVTLDPPGSAGSPGSGPRLPEIRIAVWPSDQFERLFMPVTSTPPKSTPGTTPAKPAASRRAA